VAPPPRRIAARQFDQLLFNVSLDLDLVRSRRLGPVVKGCFQAFCDESLPQALNRSQARAQSRDDLNVRTLVAVPLVCQEQNATMGQPPGSCFANSNHLFQSSPFLQSEKDPILVHRGIPFLEAQSVAKTPRNNIPRYPSIED
jgi:hypothetical protein